MMTSTFILITIACICSFIHITSVTACVGRCGLGEVGADPNTPCEGIEGTSSTCTCNAGWSGNWQAFGWSANIPFEACGAFNCGSITNAITQPYSRTGRCTCAYEWGTGDCDVNRLHDCGVHANATVGRYQSPNGPCQCQPNWIDDDCTDLDCVMSNTVARGDGGATCQCVNGFNGALCESECSGAGVLQSGTCSCYDNVHWTGELCQVDLTTIDSICLVPRVFDGIIAQTQCSGNGQCDASTDYTSCICNPPWSGDLCQTACQSHGIIFNYGANPINALSNTTGLSLLCSCDDGWGGILCQNDLIAIGICMTASSYPLICNGNGVCIDGQSACMCVVGWYGESCQQQSCDAYACNNGICTYNEYFNPHCTCNPGWSGEYCDTPIQACDCGAQWSKTAITAATAADVYMINAGAIVESDSLLNIVNSMFEQQIGSMDQAQYICYIDVNCDGFVESADGHSVAFITYNSNNPPLTSQWTANFAQFIDRHSNNRCDDMTLDPSYYIDLHMSEIVGDCQRMMTPQSGSSEFVATAGETKLNCRGGDMLMLWAQLHWQHYGHTQRYNPNGGCSLLPTIYDPDTACLTGRVGCFGFPVPIITAYPTTIVPCLGGQHGHCDAVDGTPGLFQCNCNVFSGVAITGVTLAGMPEYWGRACQYSTITTCTGTDNNISPVLCSGFVDACSADSMWDGIGVFTSTNSDYIPRCHCDVTEDPTSKFPAIGMDCEISRCATPTVPKCNADADSENTCAISGPPSSAGVYPFACSCSQEWIGQQCNVDASACMYEGAQCNGHGECQLPTLNETSPYCQCHTNTYTGTWCDKQYCPSSLMVFGHGECFNNALIGCYPVYRGSTCEVDICAQYNGVIAPWTTAEMHPTQCVCAAGWGAVVPGDVSCWPLCPSSSDGVQCGNTINMCTLTTSGYGIRSASCSCAAGYIETSSGLCEPYCIHGWYDTSQSWDDTSPPPCLCSGTGFNTNNNHPRCDNVMCRNGGTFNAATGGCNCIPPFIPYDNCVSDSCNNLPHIGGLNRGQVMRSNPPMCSCAMPFVPSSWSLTPTDCDGNICGSHGTIMSAWRPAMPAQFICRCSGRYRSVCASSNDLSTCSSLCQTSTCLNNGYSMQSDATTCVCTWMFKNGPLGVCELSRCSANAIGYNATACICRNGYRGIYCNAAIIIPQLLLPSSSSSSSSTGVSRIHSVSSSTTVPHVHSISSSSTGVMIVHPGTHRSSSSLRRVNVAPSIVVTVISILLFAIA